MNGTLTLIELLEQIKMRNDEVAGDDPWYALEVNLSDELERHLKEMYQPTTTSRGPL